MNKLNIVDIIALILVIVGGLNWGLIGINVNWNIVDLTLGGTGIDAIVYILVGLAAIYLLVMMGKLKRV